MKAEELGGKHRVEGHGGVESSSTLINAVDIGNGVPIFNETHMNIKSRKFQNVQ